jgi:putative peptidoglycan lipid II flippase
MIKSGYRFFPKIDLSDGKAKQIGLLALPILFSTWEQPINSIINIYLGSSIYKGVSALYYSNQFYLIAVGGFSMAVVNLIFPSLSRASLLEDKTQFKEIIRKAMRITLYVIFPLTIAFIILSPDIITLVFQRGEFDEVLAHYTSVALMFYSIGMVGFGIQEICRKAFDSSDNAKIPMRIAWLTISTNIVLSIILSKVMGVGGIALAASFASLLGAVIQVIMLNKTNKGIISSLFIKDMFKVVAISVIMGTIIYILRESLININFGHIFVNKLILLSACGTAGIAIYFVFTSLLKVEEAIMGINMIKAKLKLK